MPASAFSQVGGRSAPPERLRELVLRDWSTLVRDQIGEHEAALPSGEPFLADAHAVGLQPDAIDEGNVQAHRVLATPLPGSFRHLTAHS